MDSEHRSTPKPGAAGQAREGRRQAGHARDRPLGTLMGARHGLKARPGPRTRWCSTKGTAVTTRKARAAETEGGTWCRCCRWKREVSAPRPPFWRHHVPPCAADGHGRPRLSSSASHESHQRAGPTAGPARSRHAASGQRNRRGNDPGCGCGQQVGLGGHIRVMMGSCDASDGQRLSRVSHLHCANGPR